jgi:uncharacterized membrane protein YkoI
VGTPDEDEERDMDLHMTRKRAAILGGVAVIAALGVAGTAIGSSDDDSTEQPITGTALQKASEAALAETGGGTVTDTEVDDEESKYEVEVTLPDGSQVDVQLDESFHVVGSETDSEDDE